MPRKGTVEPIKPAGKTKPRPEFKPENPVKAEELVSSPTESFMTPPADIPLDEVKAAVLANRKLPASDVLGVVKDAAGDFAKDLIDGFQLSDAVAFIGNCARGFHRLYGYGTFALIAFLCGK